MLRPLVPVPLLLPHDWGLGDSESNEGNRVIESNWKRRREITPELQQAAWLLRSKMTPAEEVLWEALRGKRLDGLKFRRQHPVEQFILDFYCPRFKLVVELDGSVPNTTAEQDAARTAHLEAHGCHVVRFCNEEVLTALPSVLERIAFAANKDTEQTP